jgi:hypothetical protein
MTSSFKNFSSVKYYNQFKNTELLPITYIIRFMKEHFPAFLTLKTTADAKHIDIFYIDDCFDFANKVKPKKRQSNFSFNSPVYRNPTFTLSKLIAYSFYIKSNYAFYDIKNNHIYEYAQILPFIKTQIGKDICRDTRIINNKTFNSQLYSSFQNYYKIADIFYEKILGYLSKVNPNINYNIANYIMLLSCQNMFNLITDLISIKLNEFLLPESCMIFKSNKNVKYIINKNEISINFYFTSKLLISTNQSFNPESPCGDLSFVLSINLITETFKLSKLIINYDTTKCNIDEDDVNTNTPSVNDHYEPIKNLSYVELAPIVLGVSSIIAAPFMLAALGGNKPKSNPKYYKKHKTAKIAKTSKTAKKTKKQKNTKLIYNGG